MIMAMLIPYLKQSAAWVTDLTDSYRFNPFVKATVHIIAIQVILAALLIAITGWAILHTENSTVASIHQYITSVSHGEHPATSTLPATISSIRDMTFAYTFVIIIALNVLFGLLLIRFALSPTRSSVQFQKRFIGNIAHEIRTPLAIIKTSSEVSLMDPALNPEIRVTLRDTIGELDRISEILNNLLSLDTLVRPERMKLEPVELLPLAQRILERHRNLANSRGVALSLTIRGKQQTILGNSVALEEVLTNLLKNAINYTPANHDGKVSMHIEREFGDRISLSVIDTGIGIAQKDLMHIFEPFYRGDNSRARNIGTGTSGLGLAIVNEITRMHHGRITVRSIPDNGTTIKISFPAVKQAEKPNQLNATTLPNEGTEITLDFS
jgi:signal transduction histidine kinase